MKLESHPSLKITRTKPLQKTMRNTKIRPTVSGGLFAKGVLGLVMG